MQLFVPDCAQYVRVGEEIESKKNRNRGEFEKKTWECWERDQKCIGMGEVLKVDSQWLMWTVYIRYI